MSIAEILYMDGIQGNAPLERRRIFHTCIARRRGCAIMLRVACRDWAVAPFLRLVTGPYMRKGCQGQLSWRPDRVGGWAAYMPLTG